MTSLEGVLSRAVRAAELEVSILLSNRGCPLFTVANGPLNGLALMANGLALMACSGSACPLEDGPYLFGVEGP
jgi:hypothetical protein